MNIKISFVFEGLQSHKEEEEEQKKACKATRRRSRRFLIEHQDFLCVRRLGEPQRRRGGGAGDSVLKNKISYVFEGLESRKEEEEQEIPY